MSEHDTPPKVTPAQDDPVTPSGREAIRKLAVKYGYTGEPAPLEVSSPEDTVNNLTSKWQKLSFSDIELMVRMKADGRAQVDIANVLQCSQSTVSETLARLKQTPAVVQAIMKADTTNVLEEWKAALKPAAKRGDHRPAKEWLETAYPELRPQQGTGAGGVGVTINIGQPGSPISVPLTIETHAIESESE